MYHLEESKVIKSLKITQPDMKRQVLAATNSNFAMTDAIVKMLSIIQEASSTEQACGHWRGNLLNKVPKSDARSMGFASSSTVSVL